MMFTEEMLTQACREVSLALAESTPDTPDPPHSFSPHFLRKMKQLIGRVDHPVRYRTGQIAASFLIFLFLGFGAVMALSTTARASVVGWVRQTFGSWHQYYYTDQTNEEPENYEYYISLLPKEYIEVEAENVDGFFYGIYMNDTNQTIVFSYSSSSTLEDMFISTTECATIDILVNNQPATLYQPKDATKETSVVWSDAKNTIFYLSAVMESNDLIALAESVLPVGTTPAPAENSELTYYISALPGDYTLADSYFRTGYYWAMYTSETAPAVTFSYSSGTQMDAINVDTTDCTLVETTVNDHPATVYLSEDMNNGHTIVWTDDSAAIIFHITASLPQEELTALAESVCPVGTTPAPAENSELTYYISALPDGYSETQLIDDNDYLVAVYTNRAGENIIFSYGTSETMDSLFAAADGSTAVDTFVHDCPATVYILNHIEEGQTIVWWDNRTNVIFYITAPLPQEELTALAESVCPVGTTPAPAENSEPAYYISALPDDYIQTRSSELDGHYMGMYTNMEGSTVIFTYTIGSSVDAINVRSDNCTVVDTTVNGCPATLYLMEDMADGHTIVWTDNAEEALFQLTAALPREVLTALAESVCPTV